MHSLLSVCLWKDRLSAVFLRGALVLVPFGIVGCGLAASNPWVSTFSALLPGRGDVSRQADAIPYASIDLGINGRGGLLILAEQQDGLTFWQSSKRETIVFRQGYLNSTSGLSSDLLTTELEGTAIDSGRAPWRTASADPLRYQFTRSWQTPEGDLRTDKADATMVCNTTTEKVELPLTTLNLQKCEESARWGNGAQTRSVLWRDPDTRQVWAADAVAWPGGPRIAWQVARPWW